MEITEVRVKLMDDPHDRLQGFCSITFDASFVIRDLKIIQGAKGSFVAMPSRKLTDRCPKCNTKNHLRSLHCNQCGARLQEDRATKDNEGRAKLYADIAHPINSECREMIQRKVLEAYADELVRAKQPGYSCSYDDYGEERYAGLDESEDYDSPLGNVGPALSIHPQGPDDGSRRIEPPESVGTPPHHHNESTRHRERAAAAMEPQQLGNRDDENFGAGIE